jgi:hypothetical protein
VTRRLLFSLLTGAGLTVAWQLFSEDDEPVAQPG